ncbi:MAG: hypothetical protein QGH20_10920 [Candidatus Latescibacteria bacterium]|nr:hypothetical protein [Candidatus Latescibacterota bacterium]
MPDIHSTAVVSPNAVVADGVVIGPLSVVDDEVTIGPGTTVGPHVHLTGLNNKLRELPRPMLSLVELSVEVGQPGLHKRFGVLNA